MRFLVATLFLATPALAHPVSQPHVHSADWVVLAAFALVCAAGLMATRKVLRSRSRP